MRGYWSNPLRDAGKWWEENADKEMTLTQAVVACSIVWAIVAVVAFLWFKGIL